MSIEDNPAINYYEWIRSVMADDRFIVFLNIIRILTFIIIGILAFIMIKEIEVVKILGTDACAYCMNKTGAVCTNTAFSLAG